MSELNAPRSVLITGASSGIGLALAQHYVSQGWRVFACGRNSEMLKSIVGAEVLSFDITDKSALTQASEQLKLKLGGYSLSLVILNAGSCEYINDAMAFDGQLFERVIQTNLIATGHCLEAFMPMLGTGSRLAFMGSSVVYLPLPRAEAYGASKAGLAYLANSLRLDLASQNIGVSLICPGFVKTPLTDKNDFAMPMQVSAQEAAVIIANGLETGRNEIQFPKRFTYLLKLLSWIPKVLMVWLIKKNENPIPKEDVK